MKISGYTTSRNTVSLDYSLKECVYSLLQFCDEVIIADSTDKNDGTKELLDQLEKFDSRIKVYHKDLDYSVANHAIFDGEMKAFARSKCTGDWCWQIDNDEIVHELDAPKIKPLCEGLAKDINLLALPVVEYWGSLNKVRIDVNNWKWRLGRNVPGLTHGIPQNLRMVKDGLVYAKPGTDGCDYIQESGDPVPFATFVTPQSDALRMAAVKDQRYVVHYEQWFNQIVNQLPGVFHFSWFSIERKIKSYKNYWNNHWQSMYGEQQSNQNPFFDVQWDQVSEDMIKAKAKELRDNTGGHIFHSSWKPGMKTNAVKIEKQPPALIQDWIKSHSDE